MSAPIKVQFAHGLEGSPHGTKSQQLAREFNTLTPAMDTSDFEACIQVQTDHIASFSPQVLIGSSFGGAVVLALLQRGLWRGPTLLLAQAGLRYSLPVMLPEDVKIWLVHGLHDDVIDPQDSRRLAASCQSKMVRLLEVDDDHPLRDSVASGALIDWVRELATRS